MEKCREGLTPWWPPGWDNILPPGSAKSILAHPTDPFDKAIEAAVFQEHRFAFYFWARWALEAREHRGQPFEAPDLITLDWHQDLCAPSPGEQADLRALNFSDLNEVALFSWLRLHPHNDGHILAAAYAGLIGDIYVLCKHEDDWLTEFNDLHGRTHRTVVCHSLKGLLAALPAIRPTYFDVDLDYFTDSDDDMGGGDNVRLVPDRKVRATFDPRGPLMRAVFPRIAGMTIATEPKWCGGARASNHLFDILDRTLFDPPLLHPDAGWRAT